MDSPIHSQEDGQTTNNENEQLTPKKQLTPVQNSVTSRLKKLMSERRIQYNPDVSAEIDLSEETDHQVDKKSPERMQRNATLQEWFRKRTPKASPANTKKKLSMFKEELLQRMKAQRHEDQESRQRIFRADNEIFGEEEKEFKESDQESLKEEESDADDEDSESESIEEHEGNIDGGRDEKTQYDEEENLPDDEEFGDDNSVVSNLSESNDAEEESNKDPKSCDNSNDGQSNAEFLDKNSNSCNLSPFMDATNDAKSTDQPEPTFTNKPVNFADLQFGNELHATTSAISLHKTNSTSRIGSGNLLNELPDSQSLDSQALATEMQHLLEEQQQSQITERDNYELLLGLTTLKNEAKKMDVEEKSTTNEEDEELEANALKKSAKRKLQIESDDEDNSPNGFPTTPSSGVTKLAKLTDDLFRVDDADDRLEMDINKPFLDTVRVLFDEDEEETDIRLEKFKKAEAHNVDNEEDVDERIEDESVALRNQEAQWIDDEAFLSGSDVGSDDEAENGENEYEKMSGDEEELPDQDEIRDGIIKTHMKLQNMDEERRLNKLKEIFDNELNPGNNLDRSFRSRLYDNDWDLKALVGDPLADVGDTQSDQEEDEIMSFKDHLAKQKTQEDEGELRGMFTLASFADELSQDTVDTKAQSRPAKVHNHNPNGIAKFIVGNFYFEQENSSQSANESL